jgi:GNAT superfamily N-acetyltransferase
VNLLLVRADLQRQGIGRGVVADLERRLRGRCRRVLASVFGRNPHARRFWTSQGYHFAIDAAPVLEWYAKRLSSDDHVDPGAELALLGSGGRT